jgi:hypothetical protein
LGTVPSGLDRSGLLSWCGPCCRRRGTRTGPRIWAVPHRVGRRPVGPTCQRWRTGCDRARPRARLRPRHAADSSRASWAPHSTRPEAADGHACADTARIRKDGVSVAVARQRSEEPPHAASAIKRRALVHAADVKPGGTVAVVGDGAVGLLGVLSQSTWAPGASSPRAATRRGGRSRASSAPPISSPSAGTRASRGSRN